MNLYDNIVSKCLKNGIKVYHVYILGKWYIEAKVNGEKISYKKPIGYEVLDSSKPRNNPEKIDFLEATRKVWEYWHDKIKETK